MPRRRNREALAPMIAIVTAAATAAAAASGCAQRPAVEPVPPALVTVSSPPSSAAPLVIAPPSSASSPRAPSDAAQRSTKGYYEFTPPRAWTATPPPGGMMGETRYELPRPTGKEAVVALVHRRILARAEDDASDSGDGIGRTSDRRGSERAAEIVQDWTHRFGPFGPTAVGASTQTLRIEPDPLLLSRGVAIGAGDPPTTIDVRVTRLEHSSLGRAVLAALVDLGAVDARTESANAKVEAAYFELEGPAARVLAARADFNAMIASVRLVR